MAWRPQCEGEFLFQKVPVNLSHGAPGNTPFPEVLPPAGAWHPALGAAPHPGARGPWSPLGAELTTAVGGGLPTKGDPEKENA